MSRIIIAAFFLLTAASALAARDYDPVEMLCLVNRQRVRNGAPPLGIHPALDRTSLAHSRDQAVQRRMTHDSSTGLSLGTRVERAGFPSWKTVGENVAYGYPSEESCMDAWMKSPGHRENILNPKFTHMGSAVFYGSDTPYYTQNFAGDGRRYNFPVCPGRGDAYPHGNEYPSGGHGRGHEDYPTDGGDHYDEGSSRPRHGGRGHAGRRPPVHHNPTPAYPSSHHDDNGASYGAEGHMPVHDDYQGDSPAYDDLPSYPESGGDHFGDDGYDVDDEHCDADYGSDMGSGHGRPPYEGEMGDHHDAPSYEGDMGDHHDAPAYGGDMGSGHGRPPYEGDMGDHHDRPAYPSGGHHDRPAYEGDMGDHHDRPSYGGDHGRPSYPESDGHFDVMPSYPESHGSGHGRPAHGAPSYPSGDHHERPAYGGDHVDHVDVVKPAYGGDHIDHVDHVDHVDVIKPAYGGDHGPIHEEPAYGGDHHDDVDHVDVIKPAYGAPSHPIPPRPIPHPMPRPGGPHPMPRFPGGPRPIPRPGGPRPMMFEGEEDFAAEETTAQGQDAPFEDAPVDEQAAPIANAQGNPVEDFDRGAPSDMEESA